LATIFQDSVCQSCSRYIMPNFLCSFNSAIRCGLIESFLRSDYTSVSCSESPYKTTKWKSLTVELTIISNRVWKAREIVLDPDLRYFTLLVCDTRWRAVFPLLNGPRRSSGWRMVYVFSPNSCSTLRKVHRKESLIRVRVGQGGIESLQFSFQGTFQREMSHIPPTLHQNLVIDIHFLPRSLSLSLFLSLSSSTIKLRPFIYERAYICRPCNAEPRAFSKMRHYWRTKRYIVRYNIRDTIDFKPRIPIKSTATE